MLDDIMFKISIKNTNTDTKHIISFPVLDGELAKVGTCVRDSRTLQQHVHVEHYDLT